RFQSSMDTRIDTILVGAGLAREYASPGNVDHDDTNENGLWVEAVSGVAKVLREANLTCGLPVW
ncbi:hypothetical protein, partial [Pseudomonas asplenii]|uniref:hypothetical protein n=1 Tax=Pseudomonas asplenii TaxID=53407 RepID=UPI00235E49A9